MQRPGLSKGVNITSVLNLAGRFTGRLCKNVEDPASFRHAGPQGRKCVDVMTEVLKLIYSAISI